MNSAQKAVIVVLSIAASFASNSIAEARSLAIQVKPQSGCMLGDFDAIRQDLGFSDNQRLLLSRVDLETGRESTFPIFSGVTLYGGRLHPTSQEEVDASREKLDGLYRSGDMVQGALPSDSPRTYALILCKDSRGTGSCLDKDAKDINQVLAEYSGDRSTDPEAPDRVYFIQFLKTQDSSVIPLNAPPTSAAEVQAFAGGPRLLTTVDSAVSKAIVLRSMPLTVEDGIVRISLPYFDRGKCGELKVP